MTIPTIPGYTALEPLAQGASSVVYRAMDMAHFRPVAIKVITASELSPNDRLGYQRELTAMGRLGDHPHIVDVLASGFVDGRPYLVMPFYGNGNYGAFVAANGPMDWTEVADFGVKIASALETAHRRGFIHRDIKPANIYRGDVPRHPLLADFGVSSFVEPSLDGAPTVMVAGTPIFSAPEVLNGLRPTVASDVYALGTTLFGLLEGRPAYWSPSVEMVVRTVVSDDPPPLVGHDAPDDLTALIARMMAKRPDDRPASALAVVREFNAIQRRHGLDPTPPVLQAPDPPPAALSRSPAGSGPLADQATSDVAPPERPPEPVDEAPEPSPPPPPAPRRWAGRWSAVAVTSAVAALGLAAGTAYVLGPDTGPPGAVAAGQTATETAGSWLDQGPAPGQAWAGHTDVAGAVAWAPDGRRLATGGRDQRVRIWLTGDVAQPPLELTSDAWILDLAWSPDGSRLAGATADGTIVVWTLAADATRPEQATGLTITAHQGTAETVAWDRAGGLLASGGSDGLVRLWRPDGGAERTLTGHGATVLSLAWSSSGPDVLASGAKDGTVRLWSPDGTPGPVLDGHDDWVRSVAWAPGTTGLATAGSDRTIRLWDGVSGREVRLLPAGVDPIGPVTWSPDGALLAVGGDDGTLLVWDVAGAEATGPTTLDGSASPLVALDWSPDGTTVAVGRADGTIELWGAD